MTALAVGRVRARSIVDLLDHVDLAEIQERADLQTRVDRKYVVPAGLVEELLADQDTLQVLQIDGRRRFGYTSVYFDTPDLVSYRGAAYGRRRRFKARTRTYTDSGQCVFEVKVKGGRGETVKKRLPYDTDHQNTLTEAARRFAADTLAGAVPAADTIVLALAPTLVTTYRRTTFVDSSAGTRLTCDSDLVCATMGGDAERVVGGEVVLESKSPGVPTETDRWLWARGHRPVSLSKYCVGLAALDADLPSNKWRRTLARHGG